MEANTLESMPLERIEAEITELAGHLSAGECRWLLFVAEYDRRKGWKEWGCRTCAAWLSWKCGLDKRSAQEKLRVAHALELFALIREEFAAGRLSYSKVRALTRVATAESEADLVGMALRGTAAHVESIARGYRRAMRSAERIDSTEEPAAWRRVQFVDDDDRGSEVLIAHLTAEENELVRRAFAAAGDDCSFADALVMMAESFVANGHACRPGRDRTMMAVNVDEEVLLGDDAGDAKIEGGHTIAPETARRLACDASFVWMLRRADGTVVDVSNRRTGIPIALRRLVGNRDQRRCRFPGCSEHRYTDIHHVWHREHGGKHTAANLATLCWFHHRLVHEGGWTLRGDASGELEVITPNGDPLPRTPVLSESNSDAVAARNRESGLDIDALTTIPHWHGEGLDLGHAVSSLWYANHPEALAGGMAAWRRETSADSGRRVGTMPRAAHEGGHW